MVKWLRIIFPTQIVVNETASGRSQFDWPTHVTDIDKTEENKQLIANFMRDVIFGKAPENITEYISSEQILWLRMD
jgi:hypothetical protein